MEELKQTLICIIEEVYQKQYIGKLQVERLNPVGLVVKLGLNVDEKPIVIAADLEDDKFLDFFRKEVREKRLDEIKFFRGFKNLQEEPECCHAAPMDPRLSYKYEAPRTPRTEDQQYNPAGGQINIQVPGSGNTLPLLPVEALSKYVTIEQVEKTIGEYIDKNIDLTEYDPVFSESPAGQITSEKIEEWDNKSTFSGSYNDLQDVPALPIANDNQFGLVKVGSGLEIDDEGSLVTSPVTVNWNSIYNKPEIPDELSDLQEDEEHQTIRDFDRRTWNQKVSARVDQELEVLIFETSE